MIFKKKSKSVIIDRITELKNANQLCIGRHTYGYNSNTFVFHNPDEYIEVGSFCSIAGGVRIFGGGEHDYKRPTTFPVNYFFKNNCNNYNLDAFSKGKTIIENDVWIGHEALIMSGVKIGNGAVVGARSVVSKDVPPYAIVVGNPAKILKYRFNDDIIKNLLEIKWWNWSDETINENSDLLTGDILMFISKFLKR